MTISKLSGGAAPRARPPAGDEHVERTQAARMTGITKRVSALADGRELIYFDDADTSLPPDRAADLRRLDPRPPTAEMRLDPLTGEWIAVATARQNRVVMPPAALTRSPRRRRATRRRSRRTMTSRYSRTAPPPSGPGCLTRTPRRRIRPTSTAPALTAPASAASSRRTAGAR